MMSLIHEVQNRAQMNLTIRQKQTHRHREQTYGCHEGEAAGRNGFGVRNEQMQGIIYNG